jgi:hypothetical protein
VRRFQAVIRIAVLVGAHVMILIDLLEEDELSVPLSV